MRSARKWLRLWFGVTQDDGAASEALVQQLNEVIRTS
jgi:hypothetical protein